MHCKIEGPAAYDVLTNFEQRWRKATKWSEFGQRFKRVTRWHDDALIKLERISWILSPSSSVPNDHPKLWVSEEDDPQNWHVQVNHLAFHKESSIFFLELFSLVAIFVDASYLTGFSFHRFWICERIS